MSVGDAALGGFWAMFCRDWAVCSREFLSEPFFKINRVSPRKPSDDHEGHVQQEAHAICVPVGRFDFGSYSSSRTRSTRAASGPQGYFDR
jgi:hypothetical protein